MRLGAVIQCTAVYLKKQSWIMALLNMIEYNNSRLFSNNKKLHYLLKEQFHHSGASS